MHHADRARLAVLIDADNTPTSLAPALLQALSRYGLACVRRAYGDWTTPGLRGWKAHLHRHAIVPVQQFRYTRGKNATDSALIIDAMDLLHGGSIDGLCLASSDSDFTRLATRLRGAGKTVIGSGRRSTPEAFIAACDRFVYVDALQPAEPAAAQAAAGSTGAATPEGLALPAEPIDAAALRSLLTAAIEAAARKDGWAPVPAVGGHLGQRHPSFDARRFGHRRLSDLVRQLPYVECQAMAPAEGSTGVPLQVRLRR